MTAAEGGGAYDGVRVFSATTLARREKLGEDITGWLNAHPDRIPVNAVVRLSSDSRFHCLSIVVFWRMANKEP